MGRFGAALLALFVLMTGAAGADEGRWLRGESASFIVYTDRDEAFLRREIADLETYDSLLRLATGAPLEHAPVRAEIYIFRSTADLRRVAPRLSNGVAGFYSPSPNITAAFAVMNGSDDDAQHILFHEYAHHFMFQYFSAAYPMWYTEGFAEYFGSSRIDGDKVSVGRPEAANASWLAAGDWLPLRVLLSASPLQYGIEDAARYYALSWLFVHYLYNDPDRLAAFNAYNRGLLHGDDPIASFPTHFGMSIVQFERQLADYARHSLTYHQFQGFHAIRHEDVQVTRLSPAADELLAIAARLRYSVDTEDAPALLTQVQAIAARYRDDVFVQTVLARAHLAASDPAQALQILAPFMAGGGAEVETLAGQCLLVQAARAEANARPSLLTEARRHFARAHNADANYVPALFFYALAAQHDPAQSDNSLNVMLHAHDLSPQVAEISLNAAAMLSVRGRYEEAAQILRPLAYSPHGGANAQRARDMLEAMQRHQAPRAAVAAEAPSAEAH